MQSIDLFPFLYLDTFDSPEFGKSTSTQKSLIRLQTLYHADKQKTDMYILDLMIWLQHLIRLVRHKDCVLKPLPTRSPTRKGLDLHSKMQRFLSMDFTVSNPHKRREICWMRWLEEGKGLWELAKVRNLLLSRRERPDFGLWARALGVLPIGRWVQGETWSSVWPTFWMSLMA